MKTRSGFVSNSSSSSFILLATDDYVEEAISELSDRDKESARASMTRVSKFGQPLWYMEAYCDTESGWVYGLYGHNISDLDPGDAAEREKILEAYEAYSRIHEALRPEGGGEEKPGQEGGAFWAERYE